MLSKQAQNSLSLYYGGNPRSIEQLLKIQKSSVVNELMDHFRASSISELAFKLSIGE